MSKKKKLTDQQSYGIPIIKIAPPRLLTKEEMRKKIQSGELGYGYIALDFSIQHIKLDESFLREFWDFFSPPMIFQFQNVSKDFRREFKDELFRENE